ncbi:MAG: AAA family ATPase [Succinivibrio sp.]|nr:AAA family ATPase [Succinivibrio sp.]
MKEISQADGIEDFADSNYIYVDKTEYIYNLVKKYKRVFFSRPRRFGKSLTLNTIGTLFEQGTDPYFKDTWIHDKWSFGTYPVLRLDFLSFSTDDVEDFKCSLCRKFREFAALQGITGYTDSNEPNDLVDSIFTFAPDSWRFVLLIDEYDAQMTANINDEELYEKFRKCIRKFYGVLKTKKYIKFLAVTGVTRLKDVSIFSVGSDIKDLTYEPAFSQMIGFTRDEIKRFYDDYLRLAVSYENKEVKPEEVTEAQIDALLDRMAYHYDGFCFDRKYRNKVYSTWSVNNFLQTLSIEEEVEFGDYWYDAGGLPTILVNYLKSHGTEVLKSYEDLGGRPGATVDVDYDDFKNPSSLLSIDKNVLMCQTGYLTLKSAMNGDPDFLQLGFANQETAKALSKRLRRQLFPYMDSEHSRHARSVLEHGDAKAIVSHLNETLASVSYDNFPFDNEAVVRSLLFFYVRHYSDAVRAEGHNYKGRSDLTVSFTGRVLVLEFKFSPDGKGLESLLESAKSQIKERDYGRENLGGRELLRIACVFNASPQERQISPWQTVE